MFTKQNNMSNLFQQLGLASDDASMDRFIDDHKGLNESTYLHKAPYWNKAQSDFLKEAIKEDADWAEVIDELNARLH